MEVFASASIWIPSILILQCASTPHLLEPLTSNTIHVDNSKASQEKQEQTAALAFLGTSTSPPRCLEPIKVQRVRVEHCTMTCKLTRNFSRGMCSVSGSDLPVGIPLVCDFV